MNHKKGLAVAGLVLVGALTLTGCSTTLGGGSSEPSPTPTASATPSVTPDAGKQKEDGKHALSEDELQAIVDSMTVNSGKGPDCVTDQYGNVQILVESNLSVTDHLMWPDSLGTPFVATEPVAARSELQVSICKDPIIRGAWLTFMATTVRDEMLRVYGIDLIKLNPRLATFTDVSRVKAYAEAIDPLEFLTAAEKAKLTSDEIQDAIDQNALGQSDAHLVNTLLDGFAVLASAPRQSVLNLHIVGNYDVNGFANVAINDVEENLEVFPYVAIRKGVCGEDFAFGANKYDKRPELLVPLTCVVTPPSTGGNCVTNCNPSTECTVNCGGGCVYNCGEKTQHVPGETTPDGVTETPAPAPSGTAAPPEKVVTKQYVEDTHTDLESQDKEDENSGTLTD